MSLIVVLLSQVKGTRRCIRPTFIFFIAFERGMDVEFGQLIDYAHTPIPLLIEQLCLEVGNKVPSLYSS